MTAERILITPRSLSAGHHPALQPLRDAGYELVCPTPGKTPDEMALIGAVSDCIGWLAGVEPVSIAVIEAAAKMKVISRNGSGADNLPTNAMEKRGIVLCRAPAANARGVSELALALTLAGLRDIVPTNTGMKAGEWPRRIGYEMEGTRIGIIGLGAIGKTYAEFCLKLDSSVFGFDPYAADDTLVHPNFSRSSFEDTLRGTQVLSLHAPLPPDGSTLIGAKELELLAPNAVIVNTARAGLVDTAAMLEALETGQVGTYATDVFHIEPPPFDPLLKHPRTVLTSHIGGFTVGSVDRSAKCAVRNLLAALA